MSSVFQTLSEVNVNGHTEKKGNLTYLSWAWAWAEVKKRYPTAIYTIYETPQGINYFTDGRTAWVKTGLTIEGLEHIEYLPVMDYNNKSIPVEKLTSFDVNKAIQRSLTKAAARHGLGLYIYAGEDLPEAPRKEEQMSDKNVTAVSKAETRVSPEDRIDATHWKAFQKTIREHGIHPQWVMARYQIKPSEITYQMEHDIVMELPELAKEYMAERQAAEEAGHDGQTA